MQMSPFATIGPRGVGARHLNPAMVQGAALADFTMLSGLSVTVSGAPGTDGFRCAQPSYAVIGLLRMRLSLDGLSAVG
jgi:hypothetical protein